MLRLSPNGSADISATLFAPLRARDLLLASGCSQAARTSVSGLAPVTAFASAPDGSR
jgi:hypothetical protein